MPADPATGVPTNDADHARLRAFGEALDAVKRRIEARLGADDVAHVTRVDRFSHRMEIVGRMLIHVSFEPITFTAGVVALWVHKQLQAIEVGHSSLHGCYDRFEGAERFHSKQFVWDMPIDEASWREGHNIRHHGNTNIPGKDPDVEFGPVRLTDQVPYEGYHRWQVPLSMFVLFPNFGLMMSGHFRGMGDNPGNGDVLRKLFHYYSKNYVLYPMLAGPMFWKVLLGNWMAETMRDVWSAATIYCGHVGPDVKGWPEGTKATGRGSWYAMQAESTNNFAVSLPVSMLCGALDLQIEHHLFPKLPPNRLREIAPEVREICEAHGVAYRTDSWGRTLRKAFRQLSTLSRSETVLDGVRSLARSMA